MSVCLTAIKDVPCADEAVYDLTGMCVHEHLHRGQVCGWHMKVLTAMDAEGELCCTWCKNAGAPDTRIRVTFKPIDPNPTP